MELILERIAKRKTYTIGRLYIKTHPQPLPEREGSSYPVSQNLADKLSTPLPDREGTGESLLYFCDTLEPTWRDYKNGAYKVKGHSAIPEGRYAVVISYSPKFKQWLPILLGVPKFEGIRIHAGKHRRLHPRRQEPRGRQSARIAHLAPPAEAEDCRGQG